MATNTPVNIELLVVSEAELQRLKRVSEQQIFAQGNAFHPLGLFSADIFGPVGSDARGRTFAYIDLHAPILHPLLYRAVVDSKALHKQILQGTATAVWNAKTREFEKSTETQAQTGYHFFMQHLSELQLIKSQSDKRNFAIELFNQARKDAKHLMRYALVLPAALRDYTVTPDGKPEEDEVNAFYRRLLTQAQLVDPIMYKKNPHLYDNVLWQLQLTMQELFDYLQSLLDGKNKLVLGKWLSRKIFNSTRNVLTASVDHSTHMSDPNRLRSNDCVVGLYQFLRAAAPRSLFHVKNHHASSVFTEGSQFANLINVKSWVREEVLSAHVQRDYDRWMTLDGLDSLIASFGNNDIRHMPLTLNQGKHAMALIYNDGQNVRLMKDIGELPEHLSREHVSVATLAEFLYMSVWQMSGVTPGFITRYPINGYGGIYPCWIKVRTSTRTVSLRLLDEAWQDSGLTLPSFPVRGADFFNGISVHQSHMGLLGADFDGDTISLVAVQTDEAIEEVKRTLRSKSYYLNNENRAIFSNSTDVIDSVMAFMTN